MKKRVTLAALTGAAVISALAGFGYHTYHEQELNEVQRTAVEKLDSLHKEYDPQRIVLTDTSKAEADELAEKLGASSVRMNEQGTYAVLTLPEGQTIESVYHDKKYRSYLEEMDADTYVSLASVTPTTSVPVFTANDTHYPSQSYLNYLHVGATWNQTTGSGVKVAVIDTGIDTSHPEFAGKISNLSYNASQDKRVKDNNDDWSLIEDTQGHGTAVAGAIASQANNAEGIVGIAPDVELVVIKAECDETGNFARSSDLVLGIYYAIECDVDVINMSFGSPFNVFQNAVNLANDSDVICVAAAGNEGSAAPQYPAACEYTIGVGALAADSWALASYSNYGRENIDIVAPGTTYTTTTNNSYKVENGTSLAAPIVTGAVALYRSLNPHAEFSEIQEMLYASSVDLGDPGPDWLYGYGALDIDAFVCQEKGTVTFEMLTDELETVKKRFVRGHALQDIPEPERNYAVFMGWFFSETCDAEDELERYETVFNEDLTLYADWDNEDDGVPYTYVELSDGTIEIQSYTGRRRYITVPGTIEGKPVSSIGESAFAGQDRIREITLPEGVTQIRDNAFFRCSALTNMSIPDTVTTIGSNAFADCIRLGSVTFGKNSALNEIGSSAFAGSALRSFEVPAHVSAVDGGMFSGCRDLTAITVAAGNKSFASDGTALLTLNKSTLLVFPAGYASSYTIPASVSVIGDSSFAYARLTAVNLGNVTQIGREAFYQSQLREAVLTDSVTAMGEGAFSSCQNLKSVTLGNGLQVISKGAFGGTPSLTAISIPDSIEEIGESAFAMSGLSEITFGEDSALVTIAASAFTRTNLRQIALPAGLAELGDGVFFGTLNLAEVTFTGTNVKQIGSFAFARTLSLEEITLPEGVQEIGEQAFINSALTTIQIPASAEKIGAGAFSGCQKLAAIDVAEGNTVYASDEGVLYTADKSVLMIYPCGKTASSYAVTPETVRIEEYAFYEAGKLEQVQLPENLEDIAQYAFAGCTAMTSMDIPDHVTQIGSYAFASDQNLNSITFTENSRLPRIGLAAFAQCGITSFTVPAKVSAIAQYAFTGCDKLTSITFGAHSELNAVTAYMLADCDQLTSITFEEGSALTMIQAHGLEAMRNLQTVDLSKCEHLTTIDNYAFRFDGKLHTVSLPGSLTTIGRYAFYQCASLAELYLPEQMDYIGRYAYLQTRQIELYFAAPQLPMHLEENWDYGIGGYYTGTSNVKTSPDGLWQYTVQQQGISILKYLGTETDIDMSTLKLENKPIIAIGGYAFADSSITSLILPDSLTAIYRYAFARTAALKAITIPANVVNIEPYAFTGSGIRTLQFAEGAKLSVIGQYAFYGCENLTEVHLPDSVTELGTSVFQECRALSQVTLPESLSVIPKRAFYQDALTGITLPEGLTEVGSYAFSENAALASVTFGTGAELKIRDNAFSYDDLVEINIPANLTYLGEYCFVGNKNLTAYNVAAGNPVYSSDNGVLLNASGRKLLAYPTGRGGSYTVPNTVEVIGFAAFEDSALSEVNFEQGINLLTIGNRAFQGSAITRADIPASVVSIDYYAFADCAALAEVTFAEENKLKGVYEGAFLNCTSLKSITLPETIAEISDYAFYGCRELKELPFGESAAIRGIYNHAFAYTGLSALKLPETVIELGEEAFRGSALTSVEIPAANARDLQIGLGAFRECEELQEMTIPVIGDSYETEKHSWIGYIFGAGTYDASSTYIPQSLKSVTINSDTTVLPRYAFYGAQNLEKVELPETINEVWELSFQDCPAEYRLGKVTDFIDTLGNKTDMLYADYFGKGIVTVTLPETIIALKDSTFFDCTKLKEVLLPEGIADVDSHTFYGCSSLEKITLPAGMETISRSMFGNCSQLHELELPENVKQIEDNAFENCVKLTSVKFPASMSSLGKEAFRGCTNLAEINIPEGIQSVSFYAFYQCSSLRHVTLPSSILNIEDGAFSDCTELTKIDIQPGLQKIGDNAFFRCWKLKSVHLPESLGSIERGAFSECSKMTEITLPEHLESIGENAFFDSVSLKTVHNLSQLSLHIGSEDNGYVAYYANRIYGKDGTLIESREGVTESEQSVIEENGYTFKCEAASDGTFIYTMTAYTGEDEEITLPDSIRGTKYAIDMDYCSAKRVIIPEGIQSLSFNNCRNIQYLKLPEGLSQIDQGAFSYCRDLKEIRLPLSLTYIGAEAFAYCTSLERIEIPDQVETLAWSAFSNCMGLIEVKLPANLKVIEDQVFADCTSLRAIELPAGLEMMGNSIFARCNYLKELTLPDSLKTLASDTFRESVISHIQVSKDHPYFIEKDGILLNRQMTMWYWISPDITHLSLKDMQLERIPDSAFRHYENLEVVELPDTLTSIGDFAFEQCTHLKTVILPDTITTIGFGAFCDCSSLEDITLPASLTELGSSAFNGCSSLRSVSVPSGVTALGLDVFAHCISLQNIVLPDTLTSIGEMTFMGCDHLTFIDLPASVTEIGLMAFAYCYQLRKIVLNDAMITIGERAFEQCENLKEMTLPAGLTEIADGAFNNCSNLKSIKNGSQLDLHLGSNAYGGITLNANVIYDAEGKIVEVRNENEILQVRDGFSFKNYEDEISLVGYYGDQNEVTLPASFDGKSYKLEMEGSTAESVIIPASMTVISERAFANCKGLRKITLHDGVTEIGDYAFMGSDLQQINNVNSLQSVGCDVFRDTPYLTSLQNQQCILRCGNAIIGVNNSIKDLHLEEREILAKESLLNAYSLKTVSCYDRHLTELKDLSNLVTIELKSLPSGSLLEAAGYQPMKETLRNVVISSEAMLRSSYLFDGYSGITIYVEKSAASLGWDENFRGWNNGNKVYYGLGDKWISVNFYDADGELISSKVQTTSSFIVRPNIEEPDPVEGEGYRFVGWDLNDDGIADTIPVTSSKSIYAKALLENVTFEYTVKFVNPDGTVVKEDTLSYGDKILAPETDPSREGYQFDGWKGYRKGMLVTEDVTFTSLWTHDGDGHLWSEPEVLEPTCSEQGYTLIICSVCGETEKSSFIAATGHNWDEPVVTIAPTCDAFGEQTYSCLVCGDTLTEMINKLDHVFELTGETAASCTEAGSRDYACSVCGITYTESIAQLSHSYHKVYADESIFDSIKVVTDRMMTGTDSNGSYYYQCEHCGKIRLIGEKTGTVSTNSACSHEKTEEVEMGSMSAQRCTECGKLLSLVYKNGPIEEGLLEITLYQDDDTVYRTLYLASGSKTEIADPVKASENEDQHYRFVGWDLDGDGSADTLPETVTAAFSAKAVYQAEDHHFTAEIRKEASCTEDGEKVFTCDGCDKEQSESIPATGHKEVIDEAVEPTCTAAGKTEGSHCDVCGEVIKPQGSVAALGHEYELSEHVDPTCTEQGSDLYSCKRCGETYRTPIAAKGHTLEDSENGKAPTCTEPGYTGDTRCISCGEEFSSGTILPATGHTEEIDSMVAPDCVNTGLTQGSHCSVCGEVIIPQQVIAALGHTWSEWQILKEATCTEAGEKKRTCSVCGETEKESIVAVGHKEVIDKAVEPTCTAAGKTEGSHCEVCGEVLTAQSEVPVLSHSWSEWTTVKEATCIEAGEKKRTCSVCGETEKESIAVVSHKEVIDKAVEPTCSAAGKTEGSHCAVCGETLKAQSTVAASAHKWSDWKEVSEATVLAKATHTRTCSVCGVSETEEYGALLPASGVLTSTSFPLKLKQKTTKLAVTGMAKGDYVKSWASSNTALVTVTGKANGTSTVTANKKKTGSAKITVTLASGRVLTAAVKVQKAKVTTKSVKSPVSKKFTMKKGESVTAEAVLNPITSSDKVKYKTSNKKIVTVSSKGVIKAKKTGKAKITITSGKKKYVISVTVTQ